MKDYFRVAALPRGMNKWIDEWRTKNSLVDHYMSFYAIVAHEYEGTLSRFVVFVSENDQVADEVEQRFEEWMENHQNQYFAFQRVQRVQRNLTESPESSIILCRRSRLINSTDILQSFRADDNAQLERDLLRSVWQIITTRASRLPPGATGQAWEYFTKHRLVPALYLPPDSATGVESLRDSVASALGTVLFHRDQVFDDFMVYAATNVFFQATIQYQMVAHRAAIPMNPNVDTLIDGIVTALTNHWV